MTFNAMLLPLWEVFLKIGMTPALGFRRGKRTNERVFSTFYRVRAFQ